MKMLDLITVVVGLAVVSNITNYQQYNRVPTLSALQAASSGNYTISSYIQRGTLVDKPTAEPLQLIETYNCEECTGYGDIYITKTGTQYTVNKFKKIRTVGGKYKVIAKKGDEFKTKELGWVKAKFSADNPTYIEVINSNYIGTK